MSEWKTYKLGDISDDIAMGPFGSNLKVDNFITEGVPVIRGMNLHEGGFNKKNFAFVSEEKANSLKRCLAYPDDLVFTHRGTLGQVGIIPRIGFEKYLVSQSQMRLTVNKKILNPKYLYYFFKSPLGQKELLRNSSQVGVPAIANPTKSLKEVEISVPNLEFQATTVRILSSLEIELNLQMNQNLEAIAQAIFKEWFVNFNFPGFDGELVDGLPKGWKRGKLGEVLELLYGKALKSDTRIAGEYPVIGSSGIVDYHNEFLVEAPGIVIGRKGTIGEVIWIDENFFPIDTTFYVTDLLGSGGLYFHYFLLKEQEFKKIASDSAVPGLNRNQAMNNLVTIPDVNVIKEFNTIIQSIFLKREENNNQIKTLTQIRDSLLPKLMTGKIEIKN
jgi:type I restriction enzyme, S subunit